MQAYGLQRALAVVSGSTHSVKCIWLIIEVWKHWITILFVLWKAQWELLEDCIQLEKIATFSVSHLGQYCLICHQVIIISVWHMYHVNTNKYVYLHVYISTFHLRCCTVWHQVSSNYEKIIICLHLNACVFMSMKGKSNSDCLIFYIPGSFCSLGIEVIMMI